MFDSRNITSIQLNRTSYQRCLNGRLQNEAEGKFAAGQNVFFDTLHRPTRRKEQADDGPHSAVQSTAVRVTATAYSALHVAVDRADQL